MTNYKPVNKAGMFAAVTFACLWAAACNTSKGAKEEKLDPDSATKIVVSRAPEWAEMLKHDTGWIGADGIYSISLTGKETSDTEGKSPSMFWFSDCIYGTVDHDTLKKGWSMGHNSVAYFEGGKPDPSKIKFYYKNGDDRSMFSPNTPNTKNGDYYWLGDGVFNHAKDSTIYIAAYRIRNVPGKVFPFEEVGMAFIAIPKGSKPPYTNQYQLDAPLFVNDPGMHIMFGTCLLPNTKGAEAPNPDGYIYVYGVKSPNNQLVVARVKDSEFEDFTRWTFWNGADWGTDIRKCAGITDHVSNEMSVSFMNDGSGRVIATYQYDSNKPDIYIAVGGSPKGPFFPAKKVWHTPEIYEDIDFYTYNAKAYPHLSKPGELLISYNVNAFDFERKIKLHPHHLRPRFITVKY
ncbi:DUF4185 domain-containing protein [Mucilaginibacter limnophilus]|uniref:DUF4185 domain-containing protein n=1 Tax=Mucilaginibacter limnophilus TaxID=1932778 RepID=A0A437MWJ5_9SPHI|nr:DUF4185 domain-containing protein [Mucilaginibacter limnophilus]RVU02041.1 DUF4185 domain-containing protein [Mucilaginibacter limnophilus]